MPFRSFIVSLFLFARLNTADAHEVWIEPFAWQVPVGTGFEAHRLNGETFKGTSLPWDERTTALAEWRSGLETAPLSRRAGDIPAFKVPGSSGGLVTLVYQSSHRTITYRDYERFARFVREKGAEDILKAHTQRDLPKTPVKEAYVRFAKALVAVGKGKGEDKPSGLELEVVALDNPYTHAVPVLRFQVFYRDKPLAGNKVTVFARDAAGRVTRNFSKTSADGIVTFPAEPGMEYLVDTVVLREPARSLVVETKGAVWESLWASLTFKVPAAQ